MTGVWFDCLEDMAEEGEDEATFLDCFKSTVFITEGHEIF